MTNLHAAAHAAAMEQDALTRPLAEKVIGQYQRGLLTLEELTGELAEIAFEKAM